MDLQQYFLIILTFKEELVEHFCQYEEKNLKSYAGNQYENFHVFKNPQRPDLKESVDNLVRYNVKYNFQSNELRNPYLVVRLWLKWEMLDILAMCEAIHGKNKLEAKK